ncbi:cyclase [Streptomyces sp. SL13]|uniref:Cyclase n=1 Tax=Streptantibioticus silvisoli TaxID=2705255 RepID=A0AA90H4F8_9ACTN|nr:cyclase [Streptantibioticus silvisoli]MDI5964962.1 cyclase [Streptantibioticus silvisoli]MDI5973269.1 cyclase [Streptantibioticus silvisoli]
MKTRSVLLRMGMPVAAGLAAMALAASPAVAADVPVSFDCQATPPIGSAQTFTLAAGVDGTAPASVAAGSAFTATLAPDPLTVPTTVSGDTVNSISDLKLSLPVPSGATLTGESLSGGTVSGATVAVSGGDLVISLPGPIAGGSTFTLPTLTLDLTAGASGGTVQTQIAGTSYTDPGLTFNASVSISIITVTVPTTCYIPDSPVLSSTSVS